MIRSLTDEDFRSWYLSLAAQYLTNLGEIQMAIPLLPEIWYYYDKAEVILLLATVKLERGESLESLRLLRPLEKFTKEMDINDDISNWQKADILMRIGDFYDRIGDSDLAIAN